MLNPAIRLLLFVTLLLSNLSAHGQTLYWGGIDGIARQDLFTGVVEPILIKKIQPYARSVDVDLVGEKYYWSNWSGLERCNYDGSDVETIFTVESNRTLGIAIDSDAGKIYCAIGYLLINGTPHFGKIVRSNLDGSDLEDLVVADAVGPADVALDLVHQKMYWTDWSLDVIRRANLDGTEVEDVVTSGHIVPKGIAVDTTHEKIYWTDYGGSGPGRIKMSNLDGTGVTPIVTQSGMSPVEIAVDSTGSHIYWIDEQFKTGGVWRADLNGANAVQLIDGYTRFPWGIAVRGERIYWGDSGIQTIFRADFSGKNVEDLFSGPIEDIQRMALHPAAGQIYWLDFSERYEAAPGVKRADWAGGNFSFLLPRVFHDRGLAIDAATGMMYSLGSYGDDLIRSKLDGSNVQTLASFFDMHLEDIGGIALDPYHGHILVSGERYPYTGHVVRYQLDGTEPLDLSTSEGFLNEPGGIALDHFTGQFFWITSKEVDNHSAIVIEVVDRAGGKPQQILELPTENPFGDTGDLIVSAWERKLYWSLESTGKIQRADLDGSNLETLKEHGGVGLALDACSRKAAVSLDDVQALGACLSGPDLFFPKACVCSDFTSEGLIDLRDYSVLQLTLGL